MSYSDEILKKIKQIVHEKEPTAKIYLYGSRVRGTENPDSDWDLLILLNRKEITSDIENDISFALYDLEYEIGEVISPMIYSNSEWFSKYRVTPYFNNVMREGKLL